MRNIALFGMLCALIGCNQGNIQNKESVRQAVIDYLATRSGLNVTSMQVDVASVSFQGDRADAVVSISPKGAGAAGQGMSMRYELQRQGGKWVVKSRADSGKDAHGAAGAMGPGATPEPGGSPPAGKLPPGHPTVPPSEKK